MRNKFYFIFLFILSSFFGAGLVHAETTTISFFPKEVIQGEPLMIVVNTVPSGVKSLTFGGKPVRIFKYKNKPTGFVGIDLNKIPGFYAVTAELYDGSVVWSSVEIKERKKKEEPYSIPAKLGGDTIKSQLDLISTLATENNIFKSVKTGKKIYWISGFASPLEKTKISDEFGYSRNLGGLVMAHKGVDLVAPLGTKVMATNDGIVRIVGDYRNYGKTIIIDHGLGVLSFYLHLSKTSVKEGEFVLKGQNIGLSGQTGYADGPHLHFSIRIYGVSVDPIKFLDFFK